MTRFRLIQASPSRQYSPDMEADMRAATALALVFTLTSTAAIAEGVGIHSSTVIDGDAASSNSEMNTSITTKSSDKLAPKPDTSPSNTEVPSAKSVGENIGEDASTAAQAVGEGATAVGHATRDTAKAIGHGTRDFFHGIGEGFRKAW
jgi:hypothetical protein